LVDNAHGGDFTYVQLGDLGLKLRTKAVTYGVAGLALAGAVILSGSTLGLLNVSSSGILSLLLTDPPSVPGGVSAVYITYSSVAVHASGFNDSGWVSFPGQGTIDSLKLVNLSQTISSGTVPSLTYNLVRFDISRVMVQYMGANYSVTIPSGKLIVPIVGGVKVSASNPAAALVDIQPTVLNLGDQSSPNFTMATGARALQVPPDEVSDSMRQVGNNYPLEGHDWFQTFKQHRSESLNVSGLALSPSSLSFSVSNAGSDSSSIRMVVLTPSIRGEASGVMESTSSSIFFAVQSNGALRLLNGAPGEVESLFGSDGYSLASGASHLFSFTGTITSLSGRHAISSGTTYDVVLMGSETLARLTITAS
jgi:hypothetical protein